MNVVMMSFDVDGMRASAVDADNLRQIVCDSFRRRSPHRRRFFRSVKRWCRALARAARGYRKQ
jgi:hypothetical protein